MKKLMAAFSVFALLASVEGQAQTSPLLQVDLYASENIPQGITDDAYEYLSALEYYGQYWKVDGTVNPNYDFATKDNLVKDLARQGRAHLGVHGVYNLHRPNVAVTATTQENYACEYYAINVAFPALPAATPGCPNGPYNVNESAMFYSQMVNLANFESINRITEYKQHPEYDHALIMKRHEGGFTFLTPASGNIPARAHYMDVPEAPLFRTIWAGVGHQFPNLFQLIFNATRADGVIVFSHEHDDSGSSAVNMLGHFLVAAYEGDNGVRKIVTTQWVKDNLAINLYNLGLIDCATCPNGFPEALQSIRMTPEEYDQFVVVPPYGNSTHLEFQIDAKTEFFTINDGYQNYTGYIYGPYPGGQPNQIPNVPAGFVYELGDGVNARHIIVLNAVEQSNITSMMARLAQKVAQYNVADSDIYILSPGDMGTQLSSVYPNAKLLQASYNSLQHPNPFEYHEHDQTIAANVKHPQSYIGDVLAIHPN